VDVEFQNDEVYSVASVLLIDLNDDDVVSKTTSPDLTLKLHNHWSRTEATRTTLRNLLGLDSEPSRSLALGWTVIRRPLAVSGPRLDRFPPAMPLLQAWITFRIIKNMNREALGENVTVRLFFSFQLSPTEFITPCRVRDSIYAFFYVARHSQEGEVLPA
jgi:hypothetical protein